jgi:hypothetical protein
MFDKYLCRKFKAKNISFEMLVKLVNDNLLFREFVVILWVFLAAILLIEITVFGMLYTGCTMLSAVIVGTVLVEGFIKLFGKK